jgi:hypothetical protein
MTRDYPIHYLTVLGNGTTFRIYNLKALSFIPLVVRLSIEFGWLDKDVRGGLLMDNCGGDNILQLLAYNDIQEYVQAHCSKPTREYHEYVDDKCLLVMKQLRQMGYLKKEDIKESGLLKTACGNYYEFRRRFAEKRFKFLTEWDPTLLIPCQPPYDRFGLIPLHCVAMDTSIQGFQIVFEYGLLYYPIKKGISLLFTKDNRNRTPFRMFCEQYGSEKLMEVVEDTLIRYTSSSSSLDSNKTTTRLNIVDALLSAAIDENVHLDCVYVLMRRHPDMLMKLLPQLSSGMSSTTIVSASKNNDDDANGNANSNANGTSTSTSKNDDEILSSRSNINNNRDDMNDGRRYSSSDNEDGNSNSNVNGNDSKKRKRKRKQIDDNN